MIAHDTIEDLEKRFDEIAQSNPRVAAEVAFALASHYHKIDLGKTKVFAQKSIELFGQCTMETMEQCAAINMSIAGIPIPELIHEGVVRFRFPGLGLK